YGHGEDKRGSHAASNHFILSSSERRVIGACRRRCRLRDPPAKSPHTIGSSAAEPITAEPRVAEVGSDCSLPAPSRLRGRHRSLPLDASAAPPTRKRRPVLG